MKTGRSTGYRITQSQRLKLAAKVRAILADDPDTSIEVLVRRTGAPYDMCNFLRRRVRTERSSAAGDT